MDDKAAATRRKIALYRRYLEEGAAGEVARLYLAEIVKLEAELDAIERERTRR